MKTVQLVACVALLTLTLPSQSFGAEEIATVTDDRVNVRGQASLTGEVITQLQKGEKVILIEEIPVEKPKPGDPTKWAKIRMPANTPVWVFAAFIDSNANKVSATRLNLRAGPGENYSVIGRLERGDTVKPIRTVDEWMEIETPEKAYAFVAAEFLDRTPGASAPAVATTETAKTEQPEVPVADTKTDSAEPAKAVENQSSSPAVVTVPPALEAVPQFPAETPEPALPKADVPSPSSVTQPTEPAPKRVVIREGIVRGTKSIQAPTHFELVSTDSRKVINYLYSDDATLNLKDLKGKKIIVSGEEGIDPRWPNIPLITIESLEIAP